MRKLVRVVRSNFTPEVAFQDVRMRRLPYAIIPASKLDFERSNFVKDGEFFLCEEGPDLEIAVRALAEANPGCEVQVYGMEQAAQCPAAPMVVKKVTAEGILPA